MRGVDRSAERHVLVCAYLFAPGEAGRGIGGDEAAAWLGAPPAPGSFLWLHFNVSNAAPERFMQLHGTGLVTWWQG